MCVCVCVRAVTVFKIMCMIIVSDLCVCVCVWDQKACMFGAVVSILSECTVVKWSLLTPCFSVQSAYCLTVAYHLTLLANCG